MTRIEIDENSGFCFGVVNAIRKAEEELAKTGRLYCLGVRSNNRMSRAILKKNRLLYTENGAMPR